ncbi:Palmitoyltransferase [Coemansia sp. RSA 2703]|nr:Palmitoyltransferase [Coemansia sp. RSA 2703]
MASDRNEEYDAEFDVGKLYVWGVSLLIGFIGYTSQIFVYWSYLGGFTPKTLLVLGAFNFLLHLLYYNYYLAVTVPPGHVPLGWEPPRTGANVYELKRDTQKPRYCRMCRAFKPPRTHHCVECERCVLKMDHHCPWTNNCVGYYNQAHFLRFIYTVDVTCAFAILLHSLRLWELVKDSLNGTYTVRQPTQTEVAFLIINTTLAGLVLLFVGILSGYHLYLVGSNTTTIESREKSRVEKLVRAKRCQPTPYPYDLGFVRNLKSVFGPHVLTWWVPQRAAGSGLDFDIKSTLTPPVYWPPPGYTRDPDAPKTLFKGKDGTRVVSEVDADGELVIRQYNSSADPAALESGGADTKPFDSGRDDDKSATGDEFDFDDDDSTDSDDELIDAQPSYARSSAVASGATTSGGIQRRNVFATARSPGEYSRRYTDTQDSDSDNEPLLRVAQRHSMSQT